MSPTAAIELLRSAAMIEALEALSAAAWRPWLAVLVLTVGVILTLGTLFVQLRGLPGGVVGLVRRGAADDGRRGGAVMAAACGIASLGAGAVAVTVGGRGALAWIWIVTVLGMAIRFGEAVVVRSPGGADAKDDPGPLARGSAAVWAFGAAACAIAIGGLWQSHQTAGLLEVGWGISPQLGALVLGIVAAPFVLVPAARRPLFAAVPIAFVVLAIGCFVVIGEDPLVLSLAVGDAWNEAIGVRPAAAGAIGGAAALAMVEGVLRGTIAGMAGLGAVRPAGHGPRSAAVAMIATLAGGLTASLGALVVVTMPSEVVPIVEPELVPLERTHSRGLRPSQQVGQTVVLPLDSPLEENGHYALLFRSNPRGAPLGKLDQENNVVLLPMWEVAKNIDAVVFRSKDKERAKLASWDVRVPCTREIIESRGVQFYKLSPVDPKVEFKKLIVHSELAPQPFLPLDDFHFVAKVARARSNDESLGSHLAMYEVEGKDRLLNPKLHEFVRAGYRGPYADIEGERPPFGWVASTEITAPIGTVLDMRLPASRRGDSLGRVNRAGVLEAPAWKQMMAVTEVVIRHKADPSEDIVVPVVPEMQGGRVRLIAQDPKWEDFRDTASLTEHEPVPYIRMKDVEFQVEVHGDARLEPEFAGRRSLVPLHALSEPRGPGDELPYDPHPAEMVAMGMSGPVLARDGSEVVAARLQGALPSWAHSVVWLAALVLAIGAVAAWPELVEEPRGRPMEIVVLAACAGAGLLGFAHARVLAELAVAIAIAAGAVAILSGWSRIRAARRGPFA